MLPEPTQPHDDECVFRELFATLPAKISALICEPMMSRLFGMLCPTDELMSLVGMQTKHHITITMTSTKLAFQNMVKLCHQTVGGGMMLNRTHAINRSESRCRISAGTFFQCERAAGG
jgi:hypothetical protein